MQFMRSCFILDMSLAAILFLFLYESGNSFDRHLLDSHSRRQSTLILSRVELDKRVKLAFVDTGCSTTAVHSLQDSVPFPNYPAEPILIGTAAGKIRCRIFRKVPTCIPGLPEVPLDIVASDLSVVPSFQCWGINAIVGMNFLRDFVLTIRGREGISTLETSLDHQPRGERIPLRLRMGMPYLTVSIVGGFSQELLVDTGMEDVLTLSPEFLRRLEKAGLVVACDDDRSFTAAGAVSRKCFILRQMDVANTRFADVRVSESAHPGIGLGLLDHFNCILDFPKQEVWFERISDEKVIRIEPDASGMVVGFGPDGLASVRVLKDNSPAEMAKIKVGDELLSLNGRSAREFSYREIKREFAHGGKRVRLVLKRGETTYEVDLKLARPYEYPPQWKPEDTLPKTKFLPDDN